jgi:hypothetical protein
MEWHGVGLRRGHPDGISRSVSETPPGFNFDRQKTMKEVTTYSSNSGDRGEHLGGQPPLPIVVVMELLGSCVKHTYVRPGVSRMARPFMPRRPLTMASLYERIPPLPARRTFIRPLTMGLAANQGHTAPVPSTSRPLALRW